MAPYRGRKRNRYALDPEFRQRALAAAARYRAANAAEINARRKQRYAEDPEFRQRLQASNARSRARRGDKDAERRRERYAQDPVLREKVRGWNKAYRDAHRPQINAHQRERFASDPEFRERMRARGRGEPRRKSLLAQYGLTPADYAAMLKRQGGRCAICRERPGHRLYVDHCHVTGRVRGLLCIRCNFAVGLFKDRPDLLRAGAVYLERGFDSRAGGIRRLGRTQRKRMHA